MDTMNPTLINGFEDIIVFIRNQEKRIKSLEDELIKEKKEGEERWRLNCDHNLAKLQLEEENKNLKQQIKEYEFESCESLAKDQRLYGQIFHLEKENIKMKKEVNDMAGMFNFVVKKEEEKVKKIAQLENKIKEKEEENKKIENVIRDNAPSWVVDLCLPIWYGEEEDEEEEEEEEEELLELKESQS
tara:strand:- start:307 stop:867 length:561 start_codon:yes stop_codon:yes gene_type:complete